MLCNVPNEFRPKAYLRHMKATPECLDQLDIVLRIDHTNIILDPI